MALHCDLGSMVAAIGAGRNDPDVGKAPGELSLAALVGAATLDPDRSIREYRAEATLALRACVGVDVFSQRRLRSRSMRYARAVELVAEQCHACATRCATPPFDGPPIAERRAAADRRGASWRAGGRRLSDLLPGPALA